MKTNPPRESNLVLCYTLIGLGIFCMLLTVFLAFSLKDELVRKFREPLELERSRKEINMKAVDNEIVIKEMEIDSAKAKLKRGDIFRDPANSKSDDSGFSRKVSDEIKKLEDEKARLIARKDELQSGKRRTWQDWYEDYNLEFLLKGVLPLAIFSLFTMRLTFGELPQRNPFGVTDFEKRSLLFLMFAILVSACGFFLFVWFLTIFG